MKACRNTRHWTYSLVGLLLLLGSTLVQAQVSCDPAYVSLDDQSPLLDVLPSGQDDTANIQCALDWATDSGIPVVRLQAGTFQLSSVAADRFTGSLQGVSRTGTVLEVLDNSIDCESIFSAGQLPAAIKFIAGEPRLRFMTINVDQPCSNGWPLDTVVHFTGDPALPGNCGNNTVFGTVDRVDIVGADVAAGNGPIVGVSAFAEGLLVPGGCTDTLLGTFKLNRSNISDTDFGVVTSMRSSAQVDVNFNTFSNNYNAALFLDSYQSTTVTQNTFNGMSDGSEYFGVLALTDSPGAPARTRVVVHLNRFNVTSSGGVDAVSIMFLNDGRLAAMSTVTSENRFDLAGDSAWGVFGIDVADGVIAANNFLGTGAAAIVIAGDNPVSGWSITANSGLATFDAQSGADVWLGPTTSSCVFGPGQGASVADQGSNNAVLASAGIAGLDAYSGWESMRKTARPELDRERVAQTRALLDRLFQRR